MKKAKCNRRLVVAVIVEELSFCRFWSDKRKGNQSVGKFLLYLEDTGYMKDIGLHFL